ncbi:MAG: hypothetical protein R6U70_10065 [Bacillota bacterium]
MQGSACDCIRQSIGLLFLFGSDDYAVVVMMDAGRMSAAEDYGAGLTER